MKKRIAFLDSLKVIAVFAVIILHVTANTMNTFGISGVNKNIYNSIFQLMFFADAIFVMISGSLFLNPNKEFGLKKLYLKYILRMVLALFLFGTLYSILETYFYTKTIYIGMIPEAIKNIFTGNLWEHMWYLYLIIGLYMITPLLKKFTVNCKKNEYQYILIILFIFTILLADVSKIFDLQIAFGIFITSPYIFFYLLGDYLTRFGISKKLKTVIYCLSIISIFLIIFNNFVQIFNPELVSFTSTMMTTIIISLFLLVQSKENKFKEETRRVLENISECSLGIYLIHQLFINIVYKVLEIKYIVDYPYICLILYSLTIFIISYLVTYLLRKIKFVRDYIL